MQPCPGITGAVQEGSQHIVQVSFWLIPGTIPEVFQHHPWGQKDAVQFCGCRQSWACSDCHQWDFRCSVGSSFSLKRGSGSAALSESLCGFLPNSPLFQARLLLPAQPHHCSSGLDPKGVSGICSGISFQILQAPHLSSDVEVIK